MFRDTSARVVSVDQVIVPPGRRAINQGAVDRLKDSISRIDQQVPLSVMPMEHGTYVLIAGAHRLEACKQLERPVIVKEFKDVEDARRWEISENLARAELTGDERDEHIREWACLREVSFAPTGAKLPKPQGGRPEGGTRQIARELGIPETTVRRALKPSAPEPSPVFTVSPMPPPAEDPEDDKLFDTFCDLYEQIRAILPRLATDSRARALEMMAGQ